MFQGSTCRKSAVPCLSQGERSVSDLAQKTLKETLQMEQQSAAGLLKGKPRELVSLMLLQTYSTCLVPSDLAGGPGGRPSRSGVLDSVFGRIWGQEERLPFFCPSLAARRFQVEPDC